MHKIATNLYIS